MTTLKDLESLDVPGVSSNFDATDPGSHVQLIGGVVALLGAFGIGNFVFNMIKSKTGSEAVKSAVPEV